MKAAFINQYGNKDELVIGDIEKPQVQAGKVLIKVVASGVNPVDFHIRNGMLKDSGMHTLPLILGWDCSGIIEEVGAGVTGFNVGDKVVAYTAIGEQGSNAEYIVTDADIVSIKPEKMSFLEAAALPLASMTAYQGLHDIAGLKRGEQILIHNASGAVGSFAVQIAKSAGAYVVATSSAHKHDYVRSFGADEVYTETDPSWSGTARFDIALVAKTGDDLIRRTLHAVKQGGQVVSTFDEIPAAQAQQAEIEFTRMMVMPSRESLEAVLSLVSSGSVLTPIDTIYPLDDIQTAHERVETFQAVGKIVLTVDPIFKY